MYMKILALDIGDAWTGVAISDALGLFAQPYTTLSTTDLIQSLKNIIDEHTIKTIVIGLPKTMRGTESEQTRKVLAYKDQLTHNIPTISWILWDERLSSKRAEGVKKAITKEQKMKSHAIAAAFILDSYLTYISMQKSI